MGEYRLDLLGWFQFERLCQTLLTVPYGLGVEVWGGSKDLGRDAYAEGSLRFPDPEVEAQGPFLFQVKFVADAAQLGDTAMRRLKAMLKAEAETLGNLLTEDEWTAPRHYIVMTNVRVGATKRLDVVQSIADALPDAKVHLLDEPHIEVMLNAAPGVRLSFPQVMSIRDLGAVIEEVINRDVANRAQALLEDAQRLAEVFVPTRAYHQAVETVRRHGFVVLTGPPEMGKTSIAKMMALARASDGWDVVNCKAPNDFERAYVGDRSQIFVADDAFGSTEYRPDVADAWAAALHEIIPRCTRSHWLVCTSRSAPLNVALTKMHLQGAADRFPSPGKVVVKAESLSIEEKATMLYRHAKAASLNDAASAFVKTHGERIVTNDHFTPLRVGRFVRERLAALVDAEAGFFEIRRAIDAEIAQPTFAMAQSFAALDGPARDLLVAMLDLSTGPSRQEIARAYEDFAGDSADLSADVLISQLGEHFLRPA